MLYLQLRRIREGSFTGRQAVHNRAKLVNASGVEKGRAPFRRGAYRTADEKIAIGRQLLDKKASLPRTMGTMAGSIGARQPHRASVHEADAERIGADWQAMLTGYREAAQALWRAWHEEKVAGRRADAGGAA